VRVRLATNTFPRPRTAALEKKKETEEKTIWALTKERTTTEENKRYINEMKRMTTLRKKADFFNNDKKTEKWMMTQTEL
jgi:hypothetical protein